MESKSTSVTIVVPLPPKELSPNSRCHWAVKNKVKKAYKDEVWLACLKADAPRKRALTATLQCRFYYGTKRRRDSDNALASIKYGVDSLVDYGILADDDKITHLPIIMGYDKLRPRLEMTITI